MCQYEEIKALRHTLHRHAELSNREYRTKRILMDFLTARTKLSVVDRGAWFYAYYHHADDSPSIAFRADFDAIKMDETIAIEHASLTDGVAHKCGHDGHSATLVNLAIEVEKSKPAKNVYFIFQHAEETGDGAKVCAELLTEKNISEIYGYHNMSGVPHRAVQLIDGTTHFASTGLHLKLKGKPTHASQPEYGINPAKAIAEIIMKVERLNAAPYDGITFATIVQVDVGEAAYGIAAADGAIRMTIRAQRDADYQDYIDQVLKFSRAVCAEQKIEFDYSFSDTFPATVNHKAQADLVRRAARQIGLQIVEMDSAYRTSEDFGYYTQRVAGVIFYIGNGEDYPHIHTSQFDFRDDIIETATALFMEIINQSSINRAL